MFTWQSCHLNNPEYNVIVHKFNTKPFYSVDHYDSKIYLKNVIEVTSEYIKSLKNYGEIMLDINEIVENLLSKRILQIWRVVQKKISAIGFYF